MMSVKKVLFIDDNPPNEVIEKLRRNLQKNGITLKEDIISLDDNFKEGSGKDSKKLDIDRIKSHLEENYFRENYDVVISDYDYKDSKLDGYILIRWLKNTCNSQKERLRKAKFCLYSAQGDKLAKGLNSIEEVKKFNKTKVEDIFVRDNLADELAAMLSQEDSKFNYSLLLLESLEKYKDETFENTYPPLAGKKMHEIAEEITRDSYHGIAFQKNLVELTVSHLVRLNNWEDKK